MRLTALGITRLLWSTLPLLVFGCLRDPDVSKITCRNDEGCPVSYVCNLATSHCCSSAKGPLCEMHDASAEEIGQPTDDSGSVEVPRGSDGTSTDLSGRTSEVGNLLDGPAVQKDDASPDLAATGGRSGSDGEAGSRTDDGGQAGAATGGHGGQAGVATGGGSGAGTGGSPTAGGGSSGTGGASGAGGSMAPVCQSGDQKCSGDSVETCLAGQWGFTTACGMHQTCMQSSSASSPLCVCKIDPICSVLGNTCADSSTVASCSRDNDGCFYKTTSSACTTGSCSVVGATAWCCSCTTNGPQCASGNITQNCASSLVCERAAPTVCADANWAQWPMPNVPTDVSNGAPNAASYTDNGDGTVSDNVTGLIWQQVGSGPYTWSQAMVHCSPLALGGQKGWRLPTRIELLSLVDYSVVGSITPMINTTFFPTTLSSVYYWTSTPSAVPQSSQAWIVNFAQGGGGNIDMTTATGYALCVR